MSRIEELIEKSTNSQATMLRIVEEIDPEQKVYPEWKIKEVLAHLAGWDEATTAAVRSFLDGKPAEVLAPHGADVYNAQSVSTRQELPLVHIIREYKLERQKLLEALHQLKEEQIDALVIYPWGEEGSLYSLVHGMATHEANHAKEIEEVLTGKRPFEPDHH